ncbi:hypothetical protein BX616_007621, partial [Lobosporangium transversale]
MFRSLSTTAATFAKRGLTPAVSTRILTRGMAFPAGQKELLNRSLKEQDPEMYNIIELEKKRQRESIVLIASE